MIIPDEVMFMYIYIRASLIMVAKVKNTIDQCFISSTEIVPIQDICTAVSPISKDVLKFLPLHVSFMLCYANADVFSCSHVFLRNEWIKGLKPGSQGHWNHTTSELRAERDCMRRAYSVHAILPGLGGARGHHSVKCTPIALIQNCPIHCSLT